MSDTPTTSPLPPARAGVWFSRAQVDIKIGEATAPLIRGLQLIADALYKEALERDWCEEYDEFVTNLNASLPEGCPPLTVMGSRMRISFSVPVMNPAQAKAFESTLDTCLRREGFDFSENYEYYKESE